MPKRGSWRGVVDVSRGLYGVLALEQSEEFLGASTLGAPSYWTIEPQLKVRDMSKIHEERHSDIPALALDRTNGGYLSVLHRTVAL